MMRPLYLAFTITSSVALLAACDPGTQDETAASIARDSSLTHDLTLAYGDTFTANRDDAVPSVGAAPARVASNRTNATVTESPGSIEPASGSCASPALSDQRRCLLSYLARSDVALDRNYQTLISTLQREAGTSAKGREPATVVRLRSAQRSWLAYRDEECRRRNAGKEGPLWAPTRAQCLAEYGDHRTKELASALAARKVVSSPAAKATPSKATKHSKKRARHRR
jgi:uncharacterized protein YecT (DUF1311 family)